MSTLSFSPGVPLPTKRLLTDVIAPPNAVNAAASATQSMCRSSHTSVAAITDIALAYGNYYSRNWNGGTAPAADTGPGGSATVTASVEYPAGTFTQIKFSGSPTGTIADNSLIVSDSVAVSIPANTQFWVRTYFQCAAGTVYTGEGVFSFAGEASHVGTSGITDQTLGGTISNVSGFMCAPMAIIGTSSKPAVAIIGTSIAAGVGNTLQPTDHRHGFQKWLTASPCINLAQGGASTLDWISNHPNHILMLPYCTAMVTDHGTNDYTITDTATCIARLQTLYALMPSRQIFQTTMLMRVASSSDNWTTLNGQNTGGVANEPGRKTLNRAIRAGIPGMTGYFDVDSVLESSFESGLWRVAADSHSNTAPYTVDGTHTTDSGQYVVRDSGVIDQTRFT